jgi:hypothetical protein
VHLELPESLEILECLQHLFIKVKCESSYGTFE